MPVRRGSLHLDLIIALPLVLALGALSVHEFHARRRLQRSAESNAALDQAQNLLARWRAAHPVDTPAGWAQEQRQVDEVEILTLVLPDGRRLQGLRRSRP